MGIATRFTLILMLSGCLSCGENRAEPPADSSLPGRRDKENSDAAHIDPAIEEPRESTANSIFQKRILPIFQAQRPSSCTECHLSGVELKDYIQPSQQKTFAALITAGLVNTKQPDESKILQFISRRPEKPNLITEKVRKEEFEAFRDWIRAAVEDQQLLEPKLAEVPVGPQIPAEVIRHARTDRVLSSFIENIWTEVGRCAACHSPDRNQKQVREHGEQVSWIKLNDPKATLEHMIEQELIDEKQPAKSLLLIKPLMQVEHGGGQKMVVGDRTYKQFRRFIDDYSAIKQGKYSAAEQLPKPSLEVSRVTDVWLKITGIPEKYDKMLLQVDLYRRSDDGWSPYRVATSDRPVFGEKNLWQHSLSLTAPRGTSWAKKITTGKLPAGRYLAKLYIDRTGKLQQDPTAEFTAEDFTGQIEVESQWQPGYGRMTVIEFPR